MKKNQLALMLVLGCSAIFQSSIALASNSVSDKQQSLIPANQMAVVSLWAESDKLENTIEFYRETLGLKVIMPGVFNADGTFVTIMEGKLEQPKNTKIRWPIIALSVPSIDDAVHKLKKADIELPWGIEEFGEPNVYSRYVMFYDPAGNLIELVEWLK